MIGFQLINAWSWRVLTSSLLNWRVDITSRLMILVVDRWVGFSWCVGVHWTIERVQKVGITFANRIRENWIIEKNLAVVESKFKLSNWPTLRQLFFAYSAVSFCLLGSCLLIFRQLYFAGSAVVFCWFGSCFLLSQQLFFHSAVVFCCLGSCVLLVWQLIFAGSEVVFWSFGSCFFTRQLFSAGSAVVFWYFSSFFYFAVGFAASVVIFCCLSSCFLLFRGSLPPSTIYKN